MRHLLILILSILLLSSCNPIIKLMYGIKNPATETEESTVRYLERVGMQTNNIYALTENNYYTVASEIKIPSFYLFDANGNQIIVDEDCGALKTDFISNLNKDKTYNTTQTIKLEDIISNLVYLDGKPATKFRNNEIDYYLVIYWAQFIGRINKKSPAKWENAAFENENVSISVIKINMDFRDFWEN